MARIARAEVFDPDEVAILHVVNRCCRRCFLLGDDPITGKNYDHRKPWLEERIQLMASCFGIDLLAFAIMSNHFHLILRSRPDVVATWSDTEVARRWLVLCPPRKTRGDQPLVPSEAQLNRIRNDAKRVAQIRRRLSDISWWMRLLSQPIAARANKEEQETGRFWQGRFRAVRLCDEAALLACAAYVDLNPIRAAMAETLEQSDYTSAKRRIESLQAAEAQNSLSGGGDLGPSHRNTFRDRFLAPVRIDEQFDLLGPAPSTCPFRASDKGFLPINAIDYLSLLDWTARQAARGKSGSTPADLPPILERLNISLSDWQLLVASFGKLFYLVAGKPQTLALTRSRISQRPFRVPRSAQSQLFQSSA